MSETNTVERPVMPGTAGRKGDTMDTTHVGSTQEIWDAINVDLQQILDDVSCWEGRHAERMCGRLETAIKRLNAAVGHEREGYETAIALGYENDKLREQIARHNAEISARRCDGLPC